MPSPTLTPAVLLSTPQTSPLCRNLVLLLNGRGEKRYAHIEVEFRKFATGEIAPHIPETIRGRDVFFFPTFHPNPNEGIVRMFLTNNAIKLGLPRKLVLCVPFLPYLRQDRKDMPRVPISARLLADLIEASAPIHQILTFDTHVEQEVGFFSRPVDNIPGRMIHAEHFKSLKLDPEQLIVVAPDFGGAVRAQRFAKLLGGEIPVGILSKKRGAKNQTVQNMGYIGKRPTGKVAVLYDDMFDTGNTTITAAKELLQRGATRVIACATHGIFSAIGGSTAEEKFAQAGIEVVVTNTIPRSKAYTDRHASWLTVLPIDNFIARVIRESDLIGGSVSGLSQG